MESNNKVESSISQWIIPISRSKIFNDYLSIGLMSITAFTTFILAFIHYLTPLVMVCLFLFHILLCFFTKFDEHSPAPILHYMRSIEGILILSMFIVAIAYFFTLIFDSNGNWDINRAEMVVIYTYYLMLWVIFAGVSLLGIYFAISCISLWFVYFVQIVDVIQTPLILYFVAIIAALMSLGVWITFCLFIYAGLRKTEDFRSKTVPYQKWAPYIAIVSLILGLFLFFIEKTFYNALLQFLS